MTGVRRGDGSDEAAAFMAGGPEAQRREEARAQPPLTISAELADEILAMLRQAKGHKLPYGLLARIDSIASALVKARRRPAPGQEPQP